MFGRCISVQALSILEKTMSTSSNNYSSLEKQLLAYCWAFIETECLAMGHQVATQPELSIRNGVLPDPSDDKPGPARQCSIIEWKWYIHDRVTQALRHR